MLARSKLNSIKRKISQSLINNEISHEYFTTIIHEGRNYRGLKENIRMMKSQWCDTEKNNLVEEGKRKDLLIITENINNNLKSQV